MKKGLLISNGLDLFFKIAYDTSHEQRSRENRLGHPLYGDGFEPPTARRLVEPGRGHAGSCPVACKLAAQTHGGKRARIAEGSAASAPKYRLRQHTAPRARGVYGAGGNQQESHRNEP